ncbi:MAG: hypothetical protein V7642_98, partial [Burkholderiales bacterium]
MHNIRPHRAAGILIFTVGMAVMVAWWTAPHLLVMPFSGHVPMSFNSALCFLLAGAGLMLPESRPAMMQRAQQAAGMMMLVLAGLVGAQDVLNTDWGIDQLFATAFYGESPHLGRMAPLSSLGFVLAGVCFLLMHRLRKSKAAQLTVQALAHVILAIGIFSLIGYPLKLELLYGWYRFARMAPPTAVFFIILGGALWAAWYQALKQSGTYQHREDRRIAAFATLILFVLALTGGLAGFVLSVQRTEATLKQNLEAALANRTHFLEFVLADGVKLAQALGADPTLIETLSGIQTKSRAERARVLARAEKHLLTRVFSGVALYAPDGEPVLQTGSFEEQAPMELSARDDVVLLSKQHTVLQVRFPVLQNGKQVGTLVTQRELPVIDETLTGAYLMGRTGDIGVCSALNADDLRCLPTRLVPQGYLRVARYADGNERPASLAVDRKSGVTAVRDARGVTVVAAYGPVTGFGLGVVAKVDAVELYEPIRAQLANLLVLLTVLVIASLVLLRWQLIPLVSALLKAKREANESEAKTRSIVDNIADGLITIDAQGTIESINFAAAAMFGYAPDDVIGKNVIILVPFHLRDSHAGGMQRYARTGEARILGKSGVEVQGRKKDGTEFPIHLSIREMELDGQRLFVGIVRDVSERRRAEQEMRIAQERFHLVSQATNDVVWDVDFATARTWWNDAITHRFGYA